MLELVGRRVADEREVGFVRGDQVLEQRPVELLPVQALLDVRLLADDAGFEDGEVGGSVEVGNFWATHSAKSPVKPGSPGQPSAQVALARPYRRVEQPDLGRRRR